MNSGLPDRLYKYLPSSYVKSVVGNGKLLFRSLSYFQRTECVARGDNYEGADSYKPFEGLTINNKTQNKTSILKDGSFLNKIIHPEKIFVFCLSKVFNDNLFLEFDCDACIVINDVERFLKKCRVAAKKNYSFAKQGLKYGRVEYYDENRENALCYENGEILPFRKRSKFKNQNEYRLVISKKNAYETALKIVLNKGPKINEEVGKSEQRKKIVHIGSIENIVEVKYKNPV